MGGECIIYGGGVIGCPTFEAELGIYGKDEFKVGYFRMTRLRGSSRTRRCAPPCPGGLPRPCSLPLLSASTLGRVFCHRRFIAGALYGDVDGYPRPTNATGTRTGSGNASCLFASTHRVSRL